MGSNPINLFVRFILEIIALGAAAYWGWHLADGWIGVALAIGIPMVMALIWNIYAVPNDPSRSGKAPIPISGFFRLILEFCIFGFAAWTIFDLGSDLWGFIFLSVLVLHYFASYGRILWLLSQNKPWK